MSPRRAPDRGGRQRGSAVAEFALAAGLVVFAALAILQLTLAGYARAVLIDCAGVGARYAALEGNLPDDGAQRAAQLAAAALGERYGREVTAGVVQREGHELIEVRIVAPFPVLGTMGPRTLAVVGHAVREG